jgi:transposase-like protein
VEIENPTGFGRIRLRHVADVTAESLLPFIDEAVEPRASIHTDGWQAYWTLPDRGYEHERTVCASRQSPPTS